MPEFLRLVPPAEALSRLLTALPRPSVLEGESARTEDALGRVLASPVAAPEPLPAFARSTVDGYAVRAADTFGARDSLPTYLRVVGEIPMGADSQLRIESGQAALVHTGGRIPPSADAVVMVEHTEAAAAGEIEVMKGVAVGQNVIRRGEDVDRGTLVVEAGSRLRAQEIGGLLALGILSVEVTRQPRVGILSTGDELIPPEGTPEVGQVRDVNSFTLSALVHRAGGIPVRYGIVPDDREALEAAARTSHSKDDLLVITAGSSVSARDLTADVIAALGSPGVLVHGVSIKPGKPTILGVADGVPALGLPGNPVSAFVVARIFVVPVVKQLLGASGPDLPSGIMARVATNVASEAGREDYLPVQLEVTPDGWLAKPVYGRSNLIFTLVRADGLARIPAEATGLEQGAMVEVHPFTD